MFYFFHSTKSLKFNMYFTLSSQFELVTFQVLKSCMCMETVNDQWLPGVTGVGGMNRQSTEDF